MRRAWALVAVIAAAGMGPGVLRAQSTPPRPDPLASVPKEQLPPKGMCRVWVDGVPASRQPAPTDCASAVRNRPPNARVIFPDGRSAERRPERATTTETQAERLRTTERQPERPVTERRETRPTVRTTTPPRGTTPTRKTTPPDTTRRRKPPA